MDEGMRRFWKDASVESLVVYAILSIYRLELFYLEDQWV